MSPRSRCRLKLAIDAAAGIDENGGPRVHYFEATELALQLLGNNIAANLFLVGYAFQKGLLSFSLKALQRAIELNSIEVESNIQALEWN